MSADRQKLLELDAPARMATLWKTHAIFQGLPLAEPYPRPWLASRRRSARREYPYTHTAFPDLLLEFEDRGRNCGFVMTIGPGQFAIHPDRRSKKWIDFEETPWLSGKFADLAPRLRPCATIIW